MKKYALNIWMMGIFFCLILCGLFLFSQAGASQTEQVEVTSFSGDVEVLLKDTEEYVDAQEGMVLEPQDKIKTGSAAFVELSFNEENTNLVRLNENTNAEIALSGDEKLQMTQGEIFSSISALPSGSTFEIRTPTAVAGARGTDWVTKVTEEGTDVEALDSTPYVRYFEADGTLSQQITPISQGQMTTVRKFQKPMPTRPIPEARRQMWQQLKQDVRKRAGEAVLKRQQRPPFNRNEFLKQFKEQGGSNKSIFKSFPSGQQEKKETEGPKTLISREGERHMPGEKAYEQKESDQAGKSKMSDQRQSRGQDDQERPANFTDHKPVSKTQGPEGQDRRGGPPAPRPSEDTRPAEQKVKPREASVGGQSNARKAGNQGRTSSKNAVAPKASKAGGGRR